MTEQEIVTLLKENKARGVAYLFLHEDVKDWIKDNLFSGDILVFSDDSEFHPFISNNINIKPTSVFALYDNYELPHSPSGEWVEFEIDENGCYRILYTDMRFHWSEWNKPLWVYEKDENRSWYFTAFGGWCYEESKTLAWFLTPQIENDNGFCDEHFADDGNGECKPAIPIKIRFWRENK